MVRDGAGKITRAGIGATENDRDYTRADHIRHSHVAKGRSPRKRNKYLIFLFFYNAYFQNVLFLTTHTYISKIFLF